MATNPLSPACSRRVDQLEFGIDLASAPVLLQQAGVRELGLGVLVESFEVGIGRRGVEVEVTLLDVLAVISFLVREAKKAFLQDGIFFIPKCDGKANMLVAVADSGNAVFSPAIRARARMIVRKVIPCVAIGAVVFAHSAPLAFGKVRAPALPMNPALVDILQTSLFVRHSRRPYRCASPGCGSRLICGAKAGKFSILNSPPKEMLSSLN